MSDGVKFRNGDVMAAYVRIILENTTFSEDEVAKVRKWIADYVAEHGKRCPCGLTERQHAINGLLPLLIDYLIETEKDVALTQVGHA